MYIYVYVLSFTIIIIIYSYCYNIHSCACLCVLQAVMAMTCLLLFAKYIICCKIIDFYGYFVIALRARMASGLYITTIKSHDITYVIITLRM